MSTTEGTTSTQLHQLLARVEITDLVHRLGVCLDEGRFDEMRSLLAPEASATTPGGTAEGREAVVAQAARNHKPEDRIQHVITNVLIDLDDDHAKVRANLLVHFAAPPEPNEPGLAPPIRFTLGEVYQFDVARTPDGWRFVRIETVPVWLSGSPGRVPQPN